MSAAQFVAPIGGLFTFRNLSLGDTGQIVKAGTGVLYGWYISNNAAAARFVKVYNKATAATSGDTPVLTIQLPASSAANVYLGPGLQFPAGISARGTNLIADNDATAPTANDIVVNLFYY